ncbi:hypothetical protein PVAND_013203 [Polypedilum vanderplanki]|uniref:Uncharacterized protein n=1 Tax=Polypedilum vanderplanki TaxID=319348 RepID=A0A9J6CQT1_POLVA|nr:hypothetical protein PVAND_013203 [Polypedilum vanderplanki]
MKNFKEISFLECHLKRVDQDELDELKNFKSVNFLFNDCIDMDDGHYETPIEKLRDQIYKKNSFIYFIIMILISIILILFINNSYTFELNCNFSSDSIVTIKSLYTCTAYNLHATHEDQTVSKVNGIHQNGKSFSDVKIFYAKFQNCEYFPRGLDKFFPNLEGIFIQKSNIQHLLPGDLDGLNKLKTFDVEQNPIHELTVDFFKGKETIETVSFRNCHLRKVENGALDMLKNLKKADFFYNKCITTRIGYSYVYGSMSGYLADLYDKCDGHGVTIRKHNPEICESFKFETTTPIWLFALIKLRNYLKIAYFIMKLLALILILLLSEFSQQFTLNCNYTIHKINSNLLYTCNGFNVLTLYEDRTVTKIVGEHIEGNTNNDVIHFYAKFQNCHYIPLGLGKLYPNLEYLTIKKSNLQFLLPGDLDGLKKLKSVDFSFNPIEEINANYFSGHDEIENLNFYNCHLKKVDSGAFDLLKKLNFIDFNLNYCYSEQIRVFEIKDYLPDLYDKCNGHGVTIKVHEPEICESFDIEARLSDWIKLGFAFIIFLLIVITILVIALLRIYSRNAHKNWHEMDVPIVRDETERNCE